MDSYHPQRNPQRESLLRRGLSLWVFVVGHGYPQRASGTHNVVGVVGPNRCSPSPLLSAHQSGSKRNAIYRSAPALLPMRLRMRSHVRPSAPRHSLVGGGSVTGTRLDARLLRSPGQKNAVERLPQAFRRPKKSTPRVIGGTRARPALLCGVVRRSKVDVLREVASESVLSCHSCNHPTCPRSLSTTN